MHRARALRRARAVRPALAIRRAGALPNVLAAALAGALAGALALPGAWAMAGCAGGRRTSADDGSPAERPIMVGAADAGRAATPGAGPGGAPGAAAPASPGAAGAGRTGALEVTVTWDDAPPHVRSSSGRNACGAARSASARVHTLGGVAGAAVYLRDRAVETAQPPAREPSAALLAVRQCQVEPRVAVASPGHTLTVINDDERRLDLRVDRAARLDPPVAAPDGARGPGSPEPAAIFALPVVGSRVELRWPEPGIYRVAGADTEPGFVVVPGAGPAAVTDTTGNVRLAALPPGSYDVIVWHPPVDDTGRAIVEQAPVDITPGDTSRLTVPLTPR
jgi:hypothetical protein